MCPRSGDSRRPLASPAWAPGWGELLPAPPLALPPSLTPSGWPSDRRMLCPCRPPGGPWIEFVADVTAQPRCGATSPCGAQRRPPAADQLNASRACVEVAGGGGGGTLMYVYGEGLAWRRGCACTVYTRVCAERDPCAGGEGGVCTRTCARSSLCARGSPVSACAHGCGLLRQASWRLTQQQALFVRCRRLSHFPERAMVWPPQGSEDARRHVAYSGKPLSARSGSPGWTSMRERASGQSAYRDRLPHSLPRGVVCKVQHWSPKVSLGHWLGDPDRRGDRCCLSTRRSPPHPR